MTLEEIASTLTELFGAETVDAMGYAPPEAIAQSAVLEAIAPGSWQIQTPAFRLLVLLSEDHAWLRVLLPIVPVQEAQPFLEQFLEANFDDTQEVRYAVHDGVVWGVFQHNSGTLTSADLSDAIARLVSLHQVGLDDVFNRLVENRIQQIITAAKQQGQSLQATMQTLERFYAEGMLGGLQQTPEAREQTLAAWRLRLESLWNGI